MQRYFVEKKTNDTFLLSKDDSYHIKTVMRMLIHDKIEIVYNNETYISEIINLDKEVVAKVVEKKEELNELSTSITLVQSLVKEAKMDLILQKNTELGVDCFIPYQASRSVVKMNKNDSKKLDRWKRIVKEASEQSKRNIIPAINDLIDIDVLSKIEDYDLKILCTVNEKSKNLQKVLSNCQKHDRIIIVVGPEGGFTALEEEKLIDSGFISTSLGTSVLRTETAGIFVTSVIRYQNMG